uniref:Uncharacterized protein n=1 Tax=Arundo donax TaxID=35708 RepID=A0A0A8YDK4_ARUDO
MWRRVLQWSAPCRTCAVARRTVDNRRGAEAVAAPTKAVAAPQAHRRTSPSLLRRRPAAPTKAADLEAAPVHEIGRLLAAPRHDVLRREPARGRAHLPPPA